MFRYFINQHVREAVFLLYTSKNWMLSATMLTLTERTQAAIFRTYISLSFVWKQAAQNIYYNYYTENSKLVYGYLQNVSSIDLLCTRAA